MHNFDIINEIGNDISDFEVDAKNILNETLKQLNINDKVELSLIVVSNTTIAKINEKYRHKIGPTDVISFALEENEEIDLNLLTGFRILGDIFISYEQAMIQAQTYEHSLRRELAFLFVHGLLHLLGYDHQIEAEEKVMFQLQNQILNKLNITRI